MHLFADEDHSYTVMVQKRMKLIDVIRDVVKSVPFVGGHRHWTTNCFDLPVASAKWQSHPQTQVEKK